MHTGLRKMWGSKCGEAAAAEPLPGTRRVPREGWPGNPAQSHAWPGPAGPGSGPATPESLNNAQRAAGPIGQGRAKATARGATLTGQAASGAKEREADASRGRRAQRADGRGRRPSGRAGNRRKARYTAKRWWPTVGWDRRSAAGAPRRPGVGICHGRWHAGVEDYKGQRLR